MVGAQTAIIRATPLDRRVIDGRHLRRFDKDFTATAVIFHVVRKQDLFWAMTGASLQHEDLVVLKYDLAFYLPQALRANGYGNIIEKIRTDSFAHRPSLVSILILADRRFPAILVGRNAVIQRKMSRE